MKKSLLSVFSATVLIAGCQTITEELPSAPSANPSPGLTIPIPFFPLPGSTPAPTPRPSPTATPPPGTTPTPPPTPAPTPNPTPPPSNSGCGNPLPGPIGRVDAKVHIRGPNQTTLDSTPLVGPDANYCATIGYTDGRRFCPVRPEGHPERFACEEMIAGKAEDTGRSGPTWRRNGAFCDNVNCQNHPDNQYLLWVFKGGTFTACFRGIYCGEVIVER